MPRAGSRSVNPTSGSTSRGAETGDQ